MQGLRLARSAPRDSGAAARRQRRGLPLRKLRLDSVHTRTHSGQPCLRPRQRGYAGGGLLMKKTPPAKPGALFGENAPEPKTALPAAHRFNIDGGARGNPGPASYGVVVRDPGGKIVAELKKYIGRMTNNVAEYYGLIAALDYAESQGIRALRVEADSELLVKQMRGQYKVKSEDLRPLFERAKKMSMGFESFRIDHVYREQNREADALANEALDETSGVPSAPGAPA